MTVQELIDRLSQYPRDARVESWDANEEFIVPVSDVWISDYGDEVQVTFEFESDL